jgi:hypothetical protein
VATLRRLQPNLQHPQFPSFSPPLMIPSGSASHAGFGNLGGIAVQFVSVPPRPHLIAASASRDSGRANLDLRSN